ncbi:MAG: FKBP-type peptidyl-prolyl cis-trans isomerase [Bacteroidaceae bacterium]|nr:FKBP-type peptidyl-prolyl cis-trans isomerase [Bacteroidaceae bacterium]
MDTTPNKYITVAYKLHVMRDGKKELVEEAPKAHPYQFISGMGISLDAFEAQVQPLQAGDSFDFVIPCAEAYGPYEPERVVTLGKDVFCRDGKFQSEYIYPGAYVPLVNEDGNHFQGLVAEVRETEVVIDLNDRLAGMDLMFTGEVVESRPATNEEIQGMINMLTSDGCGCGCGECGGCGGDCDDHHHDGGCGCGHCH